MLTIPERLTNIGFITIESLGFLINIIKRTNSNKKTYGEYVSVNISFIVLKTHSIVKGTARKGDI